MRRTRRRKARQLWLPVYGQGGTTVEGLTTGNAFGGTFQLTNGGTTDGGIEWDAASVTYDQQQDFTSAQNAQYASILGGSFPTMRDVVDGSEWSLRRIVGKCFVTVSAADGDATAETRAPAIECAAGLIVCKTDDRGGPTTDFEDVNPLSQESAEDPWIWQRRWLLGASGPELTGFNYPAGAILPWIAGTQLPMSNVHYGSVMDGPHIDQKTARRIHRQERLFIVVATRPCRFTDLGGVSTEDITVDFRYHLRLLGNVRGSRGNRGNASR